MAAKEVVDLQRRIDTVIPRLSFKRICHEIAREFSKDENIRMQGRAITALQESAESFVTEIFKYVQMLVKINNRKEPKIKDLYAVLIIKKLRPETIEPPKLRTRQLKQPQLKLIENKVTVQDIIEENEKENDK